MAKGFDFTLDAAKAKPSQPLSLAMDAESVQQQWQAQFAELEDPRGRQGVEHPFLSIVMIAILATIGGATGWEDIEICAESHRDTLGHPLLAAQGCPPCRYLPSFVRADGPRRPRALLFGLGKADR